MSEELSWKKRAEEAEAEVEKWVAHTLVHGFDEMEKCPIFYDYCRCGTPENTGERLFTLQAENNELEDQAKWLRHIWRQEREELKTCRAERKVEQEKYVTWLVKGHLTAQEWKERAEEAEAENKELNALFDLQRTRTTKAKAMWQKATGKKETFPDLGELLEWLMWELETNKALLDRYQKVEKGWRDETEGIETEIKRLKAILANAGITS